MANLVPEGPDLKPEQEDTGLGGNTMTETPLHHSMRGIVFLLFLAVSGILAGIVAVNFAGN